ncbi:hypothetical protein CRM22_005817 [Opisthorchis felineus]|uniref:Kazal-like domain-containing protein n=1 Tax=Opisthorchis felineus TaxID=147828 RepID=A0A4S2LP98_OPIFE|nr:hypothetical protein CRM22_005817 [Opisthorchis felineus]
MHHTVMPERAALSNYTLNNNPLVFLCRLFAAFHIYLFPCDSSNGTVVTDGTCFTQRLSNGNCIGFISGVTTRQRCCESNGYFLNRVLTDYEFLRDHLIMETGTSNCVHACSEMYQPTCEDYICPEGHQCRVLKGEPRCICQAKCEPSDFESGVVCTTTLQQFTNRCQLKRARCELLHHGFSEIPCPQNQIKCAPNSILSDIEKRSTDLRLAKSEGRAVEMSPWIRQWLVDKRGTFQMERFRRRSLAGRIRVSRETHELEEWSAGLQCMNGEFCMLRQLSALPECVPWGKENKYGYCFEEDGTRGPFCGTNNRTYADRCELRHAGLRRQLEMRIAYMGECRSDAICENVQCPRPGMSCRSHHRTRQPVCVDCMQLPDDCNVSFQQQERTPEKRSEGDPVWTPQTNTKGWPTVCGSNGKVYSNACFLHVVNCFTDEFVDLQHSSYCVESD